MPPDSSAARVFCLKSPGNDPRRRFFPLGAFSLAINKKLSVRMQSLFTVRRGKENALMARL
jgi:hypothetical protein